MPGHDVSTSDALSELQIRLGYAFRDRALLQQADAALFVPSSAVFRQPGSDSWQVFRVADGRARLVRLTPRALAAVPFARACRWTSCPSGSSSS